MIGNDGLKTLDPSGAVPDSRTGNASDAQALAQTLIKADILRSNKRAMVRGIVDGNPPYKQADLVKAGRAGQCNVNWRIAESYLNSALGAFYDIFSEAPTYATVQTRYGNTDDQERWSGIITKHFDWLQKKDTSWDYHMQISQYEMVLYGVGPLMFPDKYDWRCKSILCENLLVPENTKSNVDDWELAVVRDTYLPHQLYEFIQNEAQAEAVGWNVAATKQAIINAHPKIEQGGVWLNWEWHQQQLKNSTFYYSASSKVILADHIFCKEFDGRISHKIVLESNTPEGTGKVEFLFEHNRRFATWAEVLGAMYYDHGGGGQHHSVTGMGVKMFSAMQYQNRLLCNLADKAFAPKMMFKPTSADTNQKFNLVQHADWGVLPAGFESVQVAVNGLMTEGLAFNREVSGTIAANLSQYRQNLQKEDGNPVTATEANFRASEQARLGKTQLNRYYAQLDGVYGERYRRASNPNLTQTTPGGKLALEFQKRCHDDGVPDEALAKTEFVRATRIVGQGSMYQRQQALEFLLGMIQLLPETGRESLVKDVIAGRAGWTMVDRYFPSLPEDKKPTEQNAFAMLQVAAMKDSVAPVITPTQNPVIFAQVFLQAATQAINSLQQGGNPHEVLAFLMVCGPAIHAHLDRIVNNPTRKQVYQVLFQQWQQLAKVTDELSAHMQEQAQQQQEAQAKQAQAQAIQNGQDPDTQIEAAKAGSKMKLDQAKAQQSMQLKQEKHNQNLALADASAAARIINQKKTQPAQ